MKINKSKKSIFKVSYILIIGVLCSFANKFNSSIDNNDCISNEVVLADPFILLYDGIYYAYGTTGSSEGFKCYISSNLNEWKLYDNFVLTKESSEDKLFWAPEVYYHNKDKIFYMFFTMNYELIVAQSNSPLGPFKYNKDKKFLKGDNIDGTVLKLNKNNIIYYRHKCQDKQQIIAGSFLNDNFEIIPDTDEFKCLELTQKWEGNKIIEGPTVFKFKDWFLMTYSANSYRSSDYGIGYAYSKNPCGPWVKFSENPILQKPIYNGKRLYGTGHNTIFKDKNGNLKIAFHAQKYKDKGDPRILYIGDLKIDIIDDKPIIQIINIFKPHISTK